MSRIPRTIWIQAIRKCGGLCWYCGREAITIDHAVPRSRGGSTAITNLLPACVWCNNVKGDASVSQFRKHLKFLIVRRLLSMGYAAVPNLHRKVEVVFYGEKNENPFDFRKICDPKGFN